jgi:transcription factor C subunit 6
LDSEASDGEGSEKANGSGGEGSNSGRSAEEEESDADEYTMMEGEEDEDADEYQEDLVMSDEDEDDEELEDDMPQGESIIGLESDDETGITPEASKGGRSSKAYQAKSKGSKALTMGRGFGPGHVQPPSRFTIGTGTKMRQRGIEEWVKGGQEYRFATFFGPTEDDIRPALQTRNYWHTQETLPSRRAGNLRRSFWVTDMAHEKEMNTTRKWYEDHGRGFFQAGQTLETLSEVCGKGYMINSGSRSMNLLIGGIQRPQVHTMRKGDFMSTSTPFGSNSKRRGWNFNLGSRIQEAQWAPNEEGNTQYLAVAVEQKLTTTEKQPALKDPNAPAFTATPSFPTSIQIWAFRSLSNGDLDYLTPPRLEQVICADWGAPKALRWCPVGISASANSSDGNVVHLGLLAGIWSDGKVRILDVSHRKLGDEAQETQYIRYSRAAFEIELPETIPSCIHWLSGTTLAVATASGVLAIWTLTRPGVFPVSEPQSSETFQPQPWFHRQITHTYILTLSSGYPSRPQFISTSAADGFDRLFDLRSPHTDNTYSARGRMLVLTQAWHEHTQSFISPDEYYMLKHNLIRSYHRNVYSIRIDSSITSCATSPVHPCILVGGSDGIVTASNSTMKVLNTKSRPWQLPWFKHEWRPPVDKIPMKVKDDEPNAEGETSGVAPVTESNNDIDTLDRDTNNLSTLGLSAYEATESSSTTPSDPILSQPLTRITEGYKAVQPGVQYPDESMRYKEGAKYLTTYEEQSAISRLAWNPNLKFGTWAVAGTNSGYLRVEDLGD